MCRGPGFAWKSVQKEALLVWSRSLCCIFRDIGLCFLNLALASVSTNAVQLARSQIPEVRELRVAPLHAATCARQMARFEFTHVRWTTDDARSRFVLSVTRTSLAGGVEEGLLTRLQIASSGRIVYSHVGEQKRVSIGTILGSKLTHRRAEAMPLRCGTEVQWHAGRL